MSASTTPERVKTVRILPGTFHVLTIGAHGSTRIWTYSPKVAVRSTDGPRGTRSA